MILDRTSKGWGIHYENNKIFKYLNTKQVKEIILYLKKHKFEKIYYQGNDLIIVLKKESIRIKEYKKIKDRPYIDELGTKINNYFFRQTISNINSLFKSYNLKLNKVTLSLSLLMNSIILFD